MKFATPLRYLGRFKNKKEISIRFSGCPTVYLEYEHARQLMYYMQQMMDGNLIEVSTKECGCLQEVKKRSEPVTSQSEQ